MANLSEMVQPDVGQEEGGHYSAQGPGKARGAEAPLRNLIGVVPWAAQELEFWRHCV